ncbi:hypothetical protein ABT009_43915 [Streptomyces sp. NPDC002896]|uniref:hypothetical protein n=1 Tax=Streptomyces sp. NPDC002896 TaxID=3154438 RepID=UPI0033232B83
MNSEHKRLHRPPRPDEELIRFHNGDTLDNIPILRLPEPEATSSRRRPPLKLLAILVPGIAVVGALAGLGLAALMDDPNPRPPARADAPPSPTPSTSPSATNPVTTASATPWTQPSSKPETETKATALEQVSIIQTPATGGDPGSSYCLIYTGSSSGPEREAILLMNAPGYQCHDMLPYDATGEHSPFMTEAPDCAAPARPAVLSFAEVGGWEQEVMYTCLTEHHGA